MGNAIDRAERYVQRLALQRKPIVLSDVDNTMRWNKSPLSSDTAQSIRTFSRKGGLFIPITGAPLRHIPSMHLFSFAFAESGALLKYANGQRKILAPAAEIDALRKVTQFLGVNVRDGPCIVLGKYRAIVEGPREAALTLISGEHTDYQGAETDIPLKEVEETVRKFVDENSLPITLMPGKISAYSYLDITTNFKKEQAVLWFLEMSAVMQVYFMGDGLNDFAAMSLPYVVPIAFKNSVPEIKEMAKKKGVLINKNGPDGGVPEALKVILRQQAD